MYGAIENGGVRRIVHAVHVPQDVTVRGVHGHHVAFHSCHDDLAVDERHAAVRDHADAVRNVMLELPFLRTGLRIRAR